MMSTPVKNLLREKMCLKRNVWDKNMLWDSHISERQTKVPENFLFDLVKKCPRGKTFSEKE